MTDYFSDDKLQATAAAGGGFGRAAGYLLQITGEDREAVRASLNAEGQIWSSVTGGRAADGVWEAVQAWQSGDHSLRYSARNTAMLARERAAKEATGRFTPEPFSRTWPEFAA